MEVVRLIIKSGYQDMVIQVEHNKSTIVITNNDGVFTETIDTSRYQRWNQQENDITLEVY